MTARAASRVAFVARARLDGDDLDEALDHLEILRARHVRAMHGTWGVALGFAVTVIDGGTRLRVDPGFAYDACGVELLSTATRELGVPRPAREAIVAVRSAGARRAPAVRLRVVQAPERLRTGEDVPLAALRPDGELDLSVRRCAQSRAVPHVVGGRVERGSVARAGVEATWAVQVDTTLAGFATTPAYFATLGPLPRDRSGVVLGPVIAVQLTDPAPTGFTLTVRRLVPASPAFGATGAAQSVASRPLPSTVEWLGVEAARSLALPPAAAVAPRGMPVDDPGRCG